MNRISAYLTATCLALLFLVGCGGAGTGGSPLLPPSTPTTVTIDGVVFGADSTDMSANAGMFDAENAYTMTGFGPDCTGATLNITFASATVAGVQTVHATFAETGTVVRTRAYDFAIEAAAPRRVFMLKATGTTADFDAGAGNPIRLSFGADPGAAATNFFSWGAGLTPMTEHAGGGTLVGAVQPGGFLPEIPESVELESAENAAAAGDAKTYWYFDRGGRLGRVYIYTTVSTGDSGYAVPAVSG